jgi:AcrR family transcriptional regulator
MNRDKINNRRKIAVTFFIKENLKIMARKKTITKEQILNAAYEVVSTEGFSHFTARNIAHKMKCSTQPIYLEFKNMDDLRVQLLEKIYAHLKEDIFPIEHTGDPLVDLPLNYIHFAKKETKMYRALFLENYGGGHDMQQFVYNYYLSVAHKTEKYRELADDVIMRLHMGTWITATGMASLMLSGIIAPTDEQIVEIMQQRISDIIEKDEMASIEF